MIFKRERKVYNMVVTLRSLTPSIFVASSVEFWPDEIIFRGPHEEFVGSIAKDLVIGVKVNER
jgi:hypothetical protein